MLNQKLIESALSVISENPGLLSSGSMPNIPLPVIDGGVFWNTIGAAGGYKLEKYMFTQHCRILNRDSVRIAWGSEQAMERMFRQIVEANS